MILLNKHNFTKALIKIDFIISIINNFQFIMIKKLNHLYASDSSALGFHINFKESYSSSTSHYLVQAVLS